MRTLSLTGIKNLFICILGGGKSSLIFLIPLFFLSCDFFSAKTVYYDTKFPPETNPKNFISRTPKYDVEWTFYSGTKAHDVINTLSPFSRIPNDTRIPVSGDFGQYVYSNKITDTGFESQFFLEENNTRMTFNYSFSRREGVLYDDELPFNLLVGYNLDKRTGSPAIFFIEKF